MGLYGDFHLGKYVPREDIKLNYFDIEQGTFCHHIDPKRLTQAFVLI